MTDNERKETISALRQLLAMCDFVDQYGDSIDADPYFDAIEIAIESLNETGWIPVSERLPSAEDCPMDCMVTRKSKFVGNYVDMAVAEANGTWTHEDWKAITLDGKATCISTRDADILAWKPLTEPWKGGEDE
jgi:hypothetical protein